MADISKLSDEELVRLYQAQKGASQPQSAPSADLSKLSNEQLIELAASKSSPAPSQRGSFIDPFVGQGLLMGWGDELKAGARAAVRAPFSKESFGQVYDKELTATRADLEGFRQRNPITATAAELGGAATGILATGGATIVPRIASPAVRAGMMAAEGAGYGGLYGAGAAEPGERTVGAAIGAGAGALGGAAVGSVAGRMADRAAGASVPTTDQLRAASQRLYDIADRAGVVVSDQTYRRIANNVALEARRAGMDHGVHPKAGAAITRLLDEVGQQQTLGEIDTLRRVLRAAASSAEPDERRVASVMIDALDDQIGRLGPRDVVAGNPRLATRALTGARELWSRTRKGEVIQDLIERAQISAPNFSASGAENALRTEFRNLAKNAGRMRQFTQEEQAAIRRVAAGGPVENALRMLGKFAPTGVVSTALSGTLGASIGGPAGAIGLPVAGYVARRAATNMTAGNADRAGQIVRSGGQIPLAALTVQQRRALAASMGTTLPVAPGFEEMFR